MRKRKKIIIGIHGIGNKPPKMLLELWWKKAICEGLQRIGHPRRFFNFELVYWSHFLHSDPLSLSVKDKNNPLYLKHPYAPANSNRANRTPSLLKKRWLGLVEKVLDALFLTENKIYNFDRISDLIIRKKFRDLDLYYHKKNVDSTAAGLHAKTAIRQELAKVLKKHKRKRILLIAHSMGSIIAYDVLTQVVPEVKIETFLTIGSPLGLPAIMKKIFREQQIDFKEEKKVPTPENIRKSWVNFSDLDDGITMNYDLCDDFKENSHHVGPVDVLVNNDYEHHGVKNPHKSYGYLRTPEVAAVIHEFLREERPSPVEILKQRWAGLVHRVRNPL
ncbi:MAG: alpha/beta hydrolase [bacterium]